MRVKCLAQEHNTMSPARARTRSARSGVERTNHEATAPPHNRTLNVVVIIFDKSYTAVFIFCVQSKAMFAYEANVVLVDTSLVGKF